MKSVRLINAIHSRLKNNEPHVSPVDGALAQKRPLNTQLYRVEGIQEVRNSCLLLIETYRCGNNLFVLRKDHLIKRTQRTFLFAFL